MHHPAAASMELDTNAYVSLLRDLISVSKSVQNAPSLGLIPTENLVSDFVLKTLAPYTKSLILDGVVQVVQQHDDGNNNNMMMAKDNVKDSQKVLEIERVSFIPGRGNLIIKYPANVALSTTTTTTTIGDSTTTGHVLEKNETNSSENHRTLAFVGSHMDVVPANPETWERDPFTLSVEGDNLYGRGTTDCLGHVALLTLLFVQLASKSIPSSREVSAILIASEENTEIPNVGVDQLMAVGKMDYIKSGPVIWIDCADSEPCMGTAGVLTWTLEAKGKLFHSGLPHQGINAMELGMDALLEIQRRFYLDFPKHPMEIEYNFMCSSTMKPTTVEGSVNGTNQIPPWVKISGDVRLAPFYDMELLKTKLQNYVVEINQDISKLQGSRGPHSLYVLEDEETKGSIELTFGTHYMEGIACSKGSLGNRALIDATKLVKGTVTPYSIMGSLPLVKELQRNGFDVQLIGFGLSTVYHGDNEYCTLTGMQEAMKILAHVIHLCSQE